MKQGYKIEKYLFRIGIAFLVSALIIFIISMVFNLKSVQTWYTQYSSMLSSFETAITSIENIYLIVLAIILAFALKSILPIIPFSAVCLVSGIVFPSYLAIILNIIGSSIWLLIKYYWGYLLGPGYITKILNKYRKIKVTLESDGNGNPWLLLAFRIIPYFPLNTVSQLYGSMHFNVPSYLFISVLGLLPRIIAYAFVGASLFDPLSFSFYLPIIILLLFMGVSALILNIALKNKTKTQMRKDSSK